MIIGTILILIGVCLMSYGFVSIVIQTEKNRNDIKQLRDDFDSMQRRINRNQLRK